MDPQIRHGKFYFFDSKGNVEAIGTYVEDVPHGTWIYYNESMDTVKVINYASVWKYMETEAQNYEIDSTIVTTLKRRDLRFCANSGRENKTSEHSTQHKMIRIHLLPFMYFWASTSIIVDFGGRELNRFC